MYGYAIFIVAFTVVAYLLYESVTAERRKAYLRRNDLTEAERHAETRASWGDRMAIISRLAVYAASAAAAFLGDILGIALTIFFTVEGIAHIYYEAASASKSRAAALTFLVIPFATVSACAISKVSSLILGIIIGILIIAGVRFAATIVGWIKNLHINIATDDAEEETSTKEEDTTHETTKRPQATARRQGKGETK